MKKLLLGPLLVPAVLAASPAAAQVAGAWRVAGDLGGRAFVVDCRFEPHGEAFGGACVDAATGEAGARPGKVHPLKEGAVAGDQVRWSYGASFMLMKFDVNFQGVLRDGRIAGTVAASGQKGVFTAARK